MYVPVKGAPRKKKSSRNVCRLQSVLIFLDCNLKITFGLILLLCVFFLLSQFLLPEENLRYLVLSIQPKIPKISKRIQIVLKFSQKDFQKSGHCWISEKRINHSTENSWISGRKVKCNSYSLAMEQIFPSPEVLENTVPVASVNFWKFKSS